MRHHNLPLILLLSVAACSSTVNDGTDNDGSTTENMMTDTTSATSTSTSTSGETSPGSTVSSSTDASEPSSSTSGTSDSNDESSTTDGSHDSSGGDTEDPSTGSSTTGPNRAVCGDGVLDDDEECDDGNLDPEDACSDECEVLFYSGNGAPCNETQALPCQAVGAECRTLIGDQGGGALCYWPAYSESETDCNETAGVWTPFDAPFVEINDISVPEPGVCISHASNLICENGDQEVCDNAAADSCFQYKLASGGDSDATSLCWWDTDEAGCGDTLGIWTSSDSMFAMNQPNSIPPGSVGSCISQVTNLD